MGYAVFRSDFDNDCAHEQRAIVYKMCASAWCCKVKRYNKTHEERWQALAHKLENAVQWIGRETYTTVTTVTTITTTKKTTTTWELLYILKAAEVNAQEAGTHTHTQDVNRRRGITRKISICLC